MADWVLDADSGAHVASVSRKDRAAITMAGRAPGHVYWLDAEQGRYVTSSWYRQAVPDWLEAFNRDDRARLLSDSVWRSTIPAGLERVVPRGDRAPTRPTESTRPFHIDSTRRVTRHRLPGSTSGWRSGPWWTRRPWRWR